MRLPETKYLRREYLKEILYWIKIKPYFIKPPATLQHHTRSVLQTFQGRESEDQK